MTVNREVFLSILAMDSYQRGYAPGIKGLETPTFGSDGLATTTVKIGNARITRDADDNAGLARAAGFYALSYTWGADTVISYRGTDFDFGAGGEQFKPDFFKGWSSFTGWGTNAQYPLAEAWPCH